MQPTMIRLPSVARSTHTRPKRASGPNQRKLLTFQCCSTEILCQFHTILDFWRCVYNLISCCIKTRKDLVHLKHTVSTYQVETLEKVVLAPPFLGRTKVELALLSS